MVLVEIEVLVLELVEDIDVLMLELVLLWEVLEEVEEKLVLVELDVELIEVELDVLE